MKKKNKEPIIIILLAALVEAIIGIIFFIFTVIRFYTSGFKKKTGIGFFKTFTNKGTKGEYLLYRELLKLFEKKNIFINVYLDNVNTSLTEIDLLALSKDGVYVFEMKNYSGYIYGTDTDKEWTQVLNKRTKNKFYNPLRQNYAHTKAVESFLELEEKQIVPMIVFSNKSKLSKINNKVNTSLIVSLRDLKKQVKQIRKNKEKVFSDEQLNYYVSKIEQRILVENSIKEQHVEEVIALKQGI